MKDKERLAIEDGLAKKPRRQPRRNTNRATPVDDEIPLHDRDLAKPKTSTETGRTKLAIEDKPKTVVAPKIAQPEASKGVIKDKLTKTQPKAQPKHDTDLDISASKSHWYSKPNGLHH